MACHWLLRCLFGRGSNRLLPLPFVGSGLAVCDPPAIYRPRDPQENPVYSVVSAQIETFLARQQQRERELRSFLGARSWYWHTASCACTVTPADRAGSRH